MEKEIKKQLDRVVNHASKKEKISWNKKMDNMVKLLSELEPLEKKIINLTAQKMPILDDITRLRNTMIAECVHPLDQLVYHDDHVHCKFCNKRIVMR